MAVDWRFWRRVAEVSGLTRADDLPFVFGPLLWAAWWSSAGHPEPWCLASLIMATLFARSAAWCGLLPGTAGLARVWEERRVLLIFFCIGALSFSLPVGAGAWLVPVALLPTAAWFQWRRRSYLSDPLLAAALMLPPLAAWLVEGSKLAKPAWLISLAAGLWTTAALVVAPVQPGSASLAELIGPRRGTAALVIRVAALAALALGGRQAGLGHWFMGGLVVALLIDGARWRWASRISRLPPWGWEGAWGAAVFIGLVLHFAAGVPAGV